MVQHDPRKVRKGGWRDAYECVGEHREVGERGCGVYMSTCARVGKLGKKDPGISY